MTYCAGDNHVDLGDGLGVWCEEQGVTILRRKWQLKPAPRSALGFIVTRCTSGVRSDVQ